MAENIKSIKNKKMNKPSQTELRIKIREILSRDQKGMPPVEVALTTLFDIEMNEVRMAARQQIINTLFDFKGIGKHRGIRLSQNLFDYVTELHQVLPYTEGNDRQ